MAVSIIIPVYNNHRFLFESVPTCMDQDVEKEIIILDDASPEVMPQDVKEFIESNKTIRLIVNKDNQGLAGARNTAILNAKYDIIMPLDSDDLLYPNVLNGMEKAIVDADIVYGNMKQGDYYFQPFTGTFTKEWFKNTNLIFCSSMFRKSIWKKAGGYTVRPGSHYEDWNFWAKCFLQDARFKYVDLLVYEHIIREDGMGSSLAKNHDYYAKLATGGLF